MLVKVGDVVKVVIGEVLCQGVVGQNEVDDIVYGLVLMCKGENVLVVFDVIKDKFDDIKVILLFKGVIVEFFYDCFWLIEKIMYMVFYNLVEGVMLVCLVLFVFFGNFCVVVIVVLVILLLLLGIFIGFIIVGIFVNLFSFGVMDFGIIVDGVVIVVENVFY